MVRTTPNITPKFRSKVDISGRGTSYDELTADFAKIKLDDEPRLVGTRIPQEIIEREIKLLLSHEINGPSFLLISGPPGSGKTMVVKKLAQKYYKKKNDNNNNNSEENFFQLNCSWLKRRSFGDPETSINILYDEASKKQQALIFIENIELSKDDLILDLMNKFRYNSNQTSNQVLVIAETRSPESIDPRLLEADYFSYEIKFNSPSPSDRYEYLKNYLSDRKHDLTDEHINQVVKWTNCYSFSDLNRVCGGVKRHSIDNDNQMTYKLFEIAIQEFRPLHVKSVCKPCDPVTWDQIGGLDEAKRILQRTVLGPLKQPEIYKSMGAKMKKGALLYGPPGCSKTQLAQALATESGHNFIHIKAPELMSKYVGDSEAEVRKIYRQAKEIAPCIIFIDEIESIAPKRGESEQNSVGQRLVTSLLLEINGVTKTQEVFTIAATNLPNLIDGALLRSGRLETHIYIPLPSSTDRESIFKIHMTDIRTKFDKPIDEVVKRLAELTKGYSGAEIAEICQTAVLIAIDERKDHQHTEWVDFEAAMRYVQPKTDLKMLKIYEEFGKGQNRIGKTKKGN